jgi:hypothetical protein
MNLSSSLKGWGFGLIAGPSHGYAFDVHLQEASKSFQQKAL